MITAADESFHPASPGDPWWTETSWFPFFVPDRKLSGTVYSFFRPTLGVCAGTVYVWDDTAYLPWEVCYGRALWHLPMPQGDLTDLALGNGLTLRCHEPLRRHTIRYDDGDALRLDLVFEAEAEPHPIGVGSGIGHFDQAGRVTGEMILHGETIAVDCFSLRDRSWSSRPDTGGLGAGYSYGISEKDVFHAVALRSGEQETIVAGFLSRYGVAADVVSGQRVVERDEGLPVRVTIEATDAEGRVLSARGECVNRLAFPAYPGNFTWMSLTRWTLDDAEVWGEDQDIWTPDLWRAYRARARR